MLSTSRSFKEVIEMAIVNYGEVDIFYKCGYFNNINVSAASVIETFKHKLAGHIPFKFFNKIYFNNGAPTFCKLVVIVPSKYISAITQDVFYGEVKGETSLPFLIDSLWAESISAQLTQPIIAPKTFTSKDFILKSKVEDYKEIEKSFNLILPTEQNFITTTNQITNLLLDAITRYGEQNINLLKYEFEIPFDLNHELFIYEFNSLLKSAIDCCVLIVPDIKLRGSNKYDLFVVYSAYPNFNLNINEIRNAIKTVWYRVLIKHGKRALKYVFLLVNNFAIYNFNSDLKTNNFNLGLYKINRKVNAIYRSIIDPDYKNFIVDKHL